MTIQQLVGDIRAEVTRINTAAGETVFNPALSDWLIALWEQDIESLEMIQNEISNRISKVIPKRTQTFTVESFDSGFADLFSHMEN